MAVQLCEFTRHPFEYAPGGEGIKVEASWRFDGPDLIELYFCSAEHLSAYLYEVRGVDPPMES